MRLVIITGLECHPKEFGFYQRKGEVCLNLIQTIRFLPYYWENVVTGH